MPTNFESIRQCGTPNSSHRAVFVAVIGREGHLNNGIRSAGALSRPRWCTRIGGCSSASETNSYPTVHPVIPRVSTTEAVIKTFLSRIECVQKLA